MSGHAKGEVYLEFVPIGRQVKVVAIDAATGVEVSVIGPVNAAQSDLQALALRKLAKRLADENGTQEAPRGGWTA
ncbi:DUF6898 family protein [Pannonibacter phragmitetus]|uniref:DUF6898 family protein n=1 Tax=Pannonibacter phragmitetus TaxID=121719 RepID=UPI003D2F50C2